MSPKTKDALRRADRMLVSAFCFVLAMAGAATAYSPSTEQFEATAKPAAVAAAPASIFAAPTIPAIRVITVSAAIPPRPLSLQSESLVLQLLAQSQCLADAMYYEARGEGTNGQMAVADVIYNRMRNGNYPRTICGVVFEGSHLRTGCQFSFTCDGAMLRSKSRGPWIHAQRLALKIVLGRVHLDDITGGATSFHAVDVQPGWAGEMERTAQIGNHIFYHPLRHWLTRGA